MNFVDYVDLEATVLRRVAHLVDQVADIVDGVVGRGVQFEDIQRVEFGLVFKAVDQTRNDPGAGRLSHAAGTAKQERLRQLIVVDGIFERGGNVLLPNHLVEPSRAIFPCRYDKILHGLAR